MNFDMIFIFSVSVTRILHYLDYELTSHAGNMFQGPSIGSNASCSIALTVSGVSQKFLFCGDVCLLQNLVTCYAGA